MTLPCLLYLAQRPPQNRWVWHGLVIGALGAAGTALYEASSQIEAVSSGWFRANGYTNAIQFGNIALLLGVLALCGWNANSAKRILLRAWLTLGFAAGLLASLLSGSRGGWLSLVLLAGLGSFHLIAAKRWRAIAFFTIIGLVGSWLALQIPQLHLKERISIAMSEAQDYREHGNAATSVGARLQMWHFGWGLYLEKPLFGWTQRGYMEKKRHAIDAKQLDPVKAEFNHPHNELLDTAAKRGTVGLLILLSVYVTPFWLFYKQFRTTNNPNTRALSMAGMAVPVAYFGFGLTQSFLPHNSGVMVYVFILCGLWAASLSANLHCSESKSSEELRI